MSKRGGGEGDPFDDDVDGDLAEVKVEPPESPAAAAAATASNSSSLTEG